jgi:hypothetical protein
LARLFSLFVDWGEDGKRSSSSKLVFDLTDVKDLDELLLNNDDKVLLDNKEGCCPLTELYLDDACEIDESFQYHLLYHQLPHCHYEGFCSKQRRILH